MTSTPKAKIYTRTGDKGKTRLVDGTTVEKHHPRVEAYGTVDELNSCLGVVRSHLNGVSSLSSLNSQLEKVQNSLFVIGSILATEKAEVAKSLPTIGESHISHLENEIDQMTLELPELRQFILPGGHLIASHLHVARTLCRRSERRTTDIAQNSENLNLILQYLNRLSDYLFVAARWVNMKMGQTDIPWNKSE